MINDKRYHEAKCE